MNPSCAACNKTVYPMEKLNCLDKFWHKGCFRCSQCAMTLNMKNYKGYNKMPYCAAHYPTTKFTAVADTPENLRLRKNTANQSNLVYHADFEKQKGTKLNVADDLETMRASKSAQIASEVSYRGVRTHREEQEMHRPDQTIEDERRNPRKSAVGRISDYDPAENHPSPYSARAQMPTIYDSNKGGRGYKQPGMYQPPPSGHQGYQPPPPNQPTSPSRNPQPPPGYGQIFNPPGRDPQQPWPSRQVPQQYRISGPPPGQYMPPAQPKSPSYRAIYEYNAADADEISFLEGDVIVEVTVIDEGWMEGRNKRTGHFGMLPSNYVEKA